MSGNWTIIELDTDGDGMPDWYETALGFNPNEPGDANGDFDGDGTSNLNEYLAATNPKSSSDVLRITSIVRNGTDYLISFPVVDDRTYRLEYKTQLTDHDWIMVADYAANFSGLAQMTDSLAAGQTSRFYRVRFTGPF